MNRSTKYICCVAVVLLVLAACSWAQDDTPAPQEPSSGTVPQEPSTGAVPAATGPDAGTQSAENPPLSGLDSPSLEPGFGARSFLLFRAQASDSVDTNSSGSLGSETVVRNAVRGQVSAELQKLWKRHPLNFIYVGAGDWFSGDRRGERLFQNHIFSGEQRYLWRTGSLALRDSFSYVPQGSFGFSSFGGVGGLTGGVGGTSGGVLSGGGIAGGVGGGVFGNGQFGSIGNHPRLTNMGIIDVTQAFSARSSIVLAGGYGLTHFVGGNGGFIDSNQSVGQVGYNYQLSRKDQLAMSYSYQQFHFPRVGAGTFNANVFQLLYGHRISGRLDLSFGGGPQWVQTSAVGLPERSYVAGSGRVSVRYLFSARTNMELTYSHYENSGSGFFAGASTNAARYSVNRSLARRWMLMSDSGYSRSTRVLKVPTQTANNADTYDFWYVGGGLHYQISRHLAGLANYQFDRFNFAAGFCTTTTNCDRNYSRHVGMIGINWTPGPIRLD
jgi:hypothetical protein